MVYNALTLELVQVVDQAWSRCSVVEGLGTTGSGQTVVAAAVVVVATVHSIPSNCFGPTMVAYPIAYSMVACSIDDPCCGPMMVACSIAAAVVVVAAFGSVLRVEIG